MSTIEFTDRMCEMNWRYGEGMNTLAQRFVNVRVGVLVGTPQKEGAKQLNVLQTHIHANVHLHAHILAYIFSSLSFPNHISLHAFKYLSLFDGLNT